MEPLIRDPRARKLSFTGSTAVGQKLVEQSAQQLLRLSMELGGNAPFLVFADADLDAAVDGAMLAKMRNIGEACTAANRFHVHESVANDFAERLAERMSALKIGRGTEDGVQVGPLITADARDGVDELVARRRSTAAARSVPAGHGSTVPGGSTARPCSRMSTRGRASCARRSSVQSPRSRRSRRTTRRSRPANDTEFGLVAYAYTTDLGRALRVAEGIESGMVGLNTGIVSNPAAPFGGVKASGYGREGGREGIEEYLEVKYVGIVT